MSKIRTPRGRLISVNQYLALVNRNDQICEYGHFACAAWHHGPCSDELISEQEAAEENRDKGAGQ